MDAQLKELLTGYGKIAGIWFDGMWDRPNADWRLQQTYKLIHDLQPAALVGANHHLKPFPGEDFQMFEKDLRGTAPRASTRSRDRDAAARDVRDENNAWGSTCSTTQYKARRICPPARKAAGYDANLLSNVGPMPNGRIQPEFTTRLKEMASGSERTARRSMPPAGPVPPASGA